MTRDLTRLLNQQTRIKTGKIKSELIIRKTIMLRRVIHKFRYNSKYIDRNPNRLSTTNRQPIFPKKDSPRDIMIERFSKKFHLARLVERSGHDPL